MSVTLYHNPRCSKSRQTLALLEEQGESITIIKYLETPPSAETLKQLMQSMNISARDMMRTKEALYKEHALDNADLSEADLIQAMVDYPKLIERPIAVKGKKAAIGRPPENVLSIL